MCFKVFKHNFLQHYDPFPRSETNHRTVGDNNRTTKILLSFTLLSYKRQYAHLPSFKRYGGGGGKGGEAHFNPHLPSYLKKNMLVI